MKFYLQNTWNAMNKLFVLPPPVRFAVSFWVVFVNWFNVTEHPSLLTTKTPLTIEC